MGSPPPWCHGGVDEPETWIRVFRTTLPELYAFVAKRVGGERALAEDVTQETWLRAVKAWRRSGPPSEPIAWLKTTARHLVLNHFRDARRRPIADVSIDAADPGRWIDAASSGEVRDGAAGCDGAADSAALLQHGLARLRDADARLIEAFHLDGRTTRELAEANGTSERAIEGRLHRARGRLKRLLEEER